MFELQIQCEIHAVRLQVRYSPAVSVTPWVYRFRTVHAFWPRSKVEDGSGVHIFKRPVRDHEADSHPDFRHIHASIYMQLFTMQSDRFLCLMVAFYVQVSAVSVRDNEVSGGALKNGIMEDAPRTVSGCVLGSTCQTWNQEVT